jgi:diaminohydroxyphosphoribosylaminopyrimidine deaminase / 5-amino-6-(5-phosphoribosylamino)uracil reductase
MSATGRDPAERFMLAAIAEAEKGLGRTTPNPAVGAVVVRGGRIVARGHHACAGGPHAEVVALREAGARARGADLYTTLEPCDHFGKTPPCSRAILDAGVRRVLVGSRDPNPKVNGRGIARLRRGGVEVVLGVARAACDRLNAPWFHYIVTGRPWVTMKAAITLDGRIAASSGDSRWVTGEEARAAVHELRDRADAVLVGAGTARADDPLLTTRLPGGRDPVRVVLDSRLSLPRKLRLFHPQSPAPTIVAHVTDREPRFGPGVEALRCGSRDGRVDLGDLLEKLARRGIVHLLVEGGAEVHSELLDEGLVDELVLHIAPKLLGGGVAWLDGPGFGSSGRMADALALHGVEVRRLGEDLEIRGYPESPVTRAAAARSPRASVAPRTRRAR